MFLEEDDSGIWRVRIDRKELRKNYDHPPHSFVRRTTLLAYSVRRLDEKRPIDDGYAPFADSADLRPGAYLLEFRDRKGQAVMRWEPDNTTR
jgi:hypothetical protein